MASNLNSEKPEQDKIKEELLKIIHLAINTEAEVEGKATKDIGPKKLEDKPCHSVVWDDFFNIKFLKRNWAKFVPTFTICTSDHCNIETDSESHLWDTADVGIFGQKKIEISGPKIIRRRSDKCPDKIMQCFSYDVKIEVSADTPGLPSGIPVIGGLGSIPIFRKTKQKRITLCPDGTWDSDP